MRGPAAKPVEFRILEGNRGHQKIPKKLVKFGTKAPRCPTWLDGKARKEWRRLAPTLERMHLLTDGDLAAFACYCKAVSDLQHADKVLQEEGRVFVTTTGYMMPRPEVAMANVAMKQIKDFAVQFGFTPSARARIDLSDIDDGVDEDLD
ncbi:hypothetical protein SDC9_11695 [bioreactor metagenome]|uniref:Phage terminase small subunit P27 family n=2 Tax=root TaxID=1 RepID=A0A644THW9_9ZZZZ